MYEAISYQASNTRVHFHFEYFNILSIILQKYSDLYLFVKSSYSKINWDSSN